MYIFFDGTCCLTPYFEIGGQISLLWGYIRTYRRYQNLSAYSKLYWILDKSFKELKSPSFFFRFPKMIFLGAYRLSIGCFNNSSLQINLRQICRGLTVGVHVSCKGISQLMKLTRIMTLFVLTDILLTCCDIKSNPEPTFSISTLKGSSHQANSKYRRTTGTQCVCNSHLLVCVILR